MKKVVHLRVFKGRKILKDENGKVENENNKVSLTYESQEWKNYLKRLIANGFCKVEVEKLFEFKDEKWAECEIPEKLKEEVLFAHKGDQTVKLTPEQQKIADLEAKLELLLNKDEKKDDIKDDDDELSDLQAKYFDKFGKKPHHMAGVKKLKKELDK